MITVNIIRRHAFVADLVKTLDFEDNENLEAEKWAKDTVNYLETKYHTRFEYQIKIGGNNG